MKVLLVNGSTHPQGGTWLDLSVVEEALHEKGSKQNGSGLAINQYEVVLTVRNVPKHTVVHFPTTYATS